MIDVVGEPQELTQFFIHTMPTAAFVGGDYWGHYRKCLKSGVPYVYSNHDVESMRRNSNPAREREAMEHAIHVLFTSEDHQAYCDARYNLPPNDVVYLRPLRKALEFEPLPKLPGRNLVYAGGLVGWEERDGAFGYRAYHEIFRTFIKAGWNVHVYPCYGAGGALTKEYEDLGCIMHTHVPQNDLPRECSQYTAGLQSYANEGCEPKAFAYTQTCRPNKLWESLAAGIPTIGYNPGNGGSLYDGKWGIVLNSLDEVADLGDRLADLAIPDDLRYDNVIENDSVVFDEIAARMLRRL